MHMSFSLSTIGLFTHKEMLMTTAGNLRKGG
ncbi:hypothetical protein YPPY13_1354, partial [Yersinia pestis PY-13]